MAEPRTLKFDDDYRSIEFTDMGERGILIEIDAPWAGSTESGFGQTLSVTLPRIQVDEFLVWLEDGSK